MKLEDIQYPLGEWEPQLDERVVDLRREDEGQVGVVVACNRYGHFADPYWRVSVRWDNNFVESGIETSWLVREDGTQARR